MAGSVQRQKVYVQVTEFCLLAKALRAASSTPESPAKARQITPRFTAQRMYDARQFTMAEIATSCGVTAMTIYRHIHTGGQPRPA